MTVTQDTIDAPQSAQECRDFVEAFARVNIETLRGVMVDSLAEATIAVHEIAPDWEDSAVLAESGLKDSPIDERVRSGEWYLHIDVAMSVKGTHATRLFLQLTGLSEKQQKYLFPALSATRRTDRAAVSSEVQKLNHWLDWVRRDSFDPSLFIKHQESIKLHGRTQNTTGAIGAVGASIAFLDAIRTRNPTAIIDMVGAEPPSRKEGQSPADVSRWRLANPAPVSTILLHNGRAIVFASSKDVNIFMPLGKPFESATDAQFRFNSVRNDAQARQQVLHEFAVGEVKTATDNSNLHERLGLASRETQTELRTGRFLMMALLTKELLEGGVQRRTMNNRDLKRFSHMFNLHHCWGWDGGRERHPEHWEFFLGKIGTWCGI